MRKSKPPAPKRSSQLWYTPGDYQLVKEAAKLDRRPMTTFAILATVKAARDVIAAHERQQAEEKKT